ncbi:MAG: GNAT family N-acetyltransferase [Planctomycetaceae bacterium]|jgi:RimJ/RimL family protein N-acetyltransferase|nr:GNAT family N-acetyltransferase [Planctomycetaceae bacterium]
MLKGKYTALRAVEKDDLPQLMEWRNRPEYRRFFREYLELNADKQQRWFDKLVLNDPNTVMFAIASLETGELLGACGLCYINWQNRTADFSIYIGKDNLYIDDKYAVDAANVMIRYGINELGVHRFWSEIYDFDEQKVRMFNTLGFTLDGRHRKTHWTEGKWCDSLYYALLDDDLREDYFAA